jgi:hypothetical protein
MRLTTSRHHGTNSARKTVFARPLGIAIGACLVLLLGCPFPLLAQATRSQNYSTVYATIRYDKAEDLYRFTRNIGSGISFLGESPEHNPLLAKKRVDKIVDKVMALLDMRSPNFHFSIYLCRTPAEVETAYRRTGMAGPVPEAFYAHANRSITLLPDTINDGMLAHEIAHAVISAYFGTPPPARMQEVLAQYVDSHLE